MDHGAVEELARRSGRDETEVAGEAVRLAAQEPEEPDGTDRARHVGAYLVGERRAQLAAAVGARVWVAGVSPAI